MVYLVGAGPGDPGLITVKGLQKLREADVVVYDYLADAGIVREAREDAELIYVGKKGKNHSAEQPDINALLVTKANEGKTVVRLKGGDPYLFGRGGEEAQELQVAGIAFEVVPGVTSGIAAPAYAGIPVTHRDHASMVTFITGHQDPSKEESAIDWDVLARSRGTLVFLMGVKNLGNISESLISHGKPPGTPAALVRWGTTSRQESLVSTVASIPDDAHARGFKPPSVLVVGHVVSLHRELGWFERKPLFGKRVLVTRAREQSRKMADRILELGGEPVLFPTIRILPPVDLAPLDASIARIGSYDWVVFTSVNGVDRFFERFLQVRDDIREMAGPRIGAIGPVTADRIRARGIKVERVAKEFTAEGVLELLSGDDVRGKRFLIPRAEKAREILPQGIAELGGEADVVPVYRTGLPDDAEVARIRGMLERGEIDVITFTSSSTVSHFVEMVGLDAARRLQEGVLVASIGPVTSETIRHNGLPLGVEAESYTVDGLLEALVAHMQRQKVSA
ncbi:MAG: uroporphyrinogen-III C-methyltransferase [Thermodesulfobacteriota bacterium]